MEGGLQYFVDEVNGPGTWQKRTEEQRQFARDNAWTGVAQANDADVVSCNDLRKMTMPVLLVRGEKGPGWLATVLNEVQKCLPAATRVTIPNAAHLMNRDNPAAFDEALTAFLSK